MKIEIYHQLAPIFRERAFGPLAKVATLETSQAVDDALEAAFRMTNHIDRAWNENPGPDLTPEPGEHRSTAVGDLAVVTDGALVSAWQCARAGWIPVDPAQAGLSPALPSPAAASAGDPSGSWRRAAPARRR